MTACQEMMPLIEKLEKELKVKVKKVEVFMIGGAASFAIRSGSMGAMLN